MSVYSYLFDSEYAQRKDIERLKSHAVDQREADRQAEQRAQALERRLGKVELLVEALTELIVSRKVASREELLVLMQQIDLSDGFEDGVKREHTPVSAPTCGACGRYLNPSRGYCVYCGAPSNVTPAPVRPVPPRVVTCGSCRKSVPLKATLYTEDGIRCNECYQP